MSRKAPSHGYEDIDEVKDPDGVVAVVSRRRSTGALTVGFFKEFERNGIRERTSFFEVKHFAAVRRILSVVEERMRRLGAASAVTAQ